MKNFPNYMDSIKLSGIRVIGERAAALAAEGRSIIKLQVEEPDFGHAPSHHQCSH